MRSFFLPVFLVFVIALSAQTNQFLTKSDSDPAALRLLDKLDAQLSQDRLSLEFEMSLTQPAEKPVRFKGRLIQQGRMYRIITENVEIWCNGVLRWVYTKDAKEVNLSSTDENESTGPLSLITEYTGDQYIAVISGSDQIRSVSVQIIELKPVDRESEIAKVRLSLQQDGKPVRMDIMEKTASRTVCDITRITVPAEQPATYFMFNNADYPGVHLEDLRID